MIHSNLDQWLMKIKQAMQYNIPTRTHKVLPNPIITPQILALKTQYNNLVTDPLRTYWNLQQRTEFTRLQSALQEEYKIARKNMWENLLTQIEIDKKDSRIFWEKLKKLMGTSATEKTYILDDNGAKKYEPSEKEPVFRRHWKNVLKSVKKKTEISVKKRKEKL